MAAAKKSIELDELLSDEVRDGLHQAAMRRGVRLLFAQGGAPSLAATLAAALVVLLGWDSGQHAWLIGLFTLVAIAGMVRLATIHRYNRRTDAQGDLNTWHRRYLVVQWVQGLCIGALYFYSGMATPSWVALAVAVIAVGQSSVSLLSLGASLPAYMGLVVPAITGSALGLLTHQSVETNIVAAGMALAAVLMIASATRWRSHVISATEYALLNRRLARSLVQARSRAQAYTHELAQSADERARIRVALAQMRERAQVTLESIGDGVVVCDADGHIEFINPSAADMLRLPAGTDLHQMLWQAVSLVDSRTGVPVDLEELTIGARRNTRLPVDLELNRGDGDQALSVSATLSPVSTGREASSPGGWVLVLHDQTELRGLTSAMMFQASHDSLTQVYNRREFESRLGAMLEAADPLSEHALLFMDLDKFKVINDTNGHAAGDTLLHEIAKVINSFTQSGEILARLGGDEFGLLIPGTELREAQIRASNLVRAVREYRMSWDEQIFSVGVSIGIVMLDGSVDSAGDALSRADHACYVAKDKGGNRFYVHNEKDDELQRHKTISRWLTRLQTAIAEDRFELYVQPIVSVQTTHVDELFGEILLRLRTPDGQIVSPADFLPSAERYRLMPEIDRLVVQTFTDWLVDNRGNLPFTAFMVNLSGQSFSDTAFHEYLENCLQTRPEIAKWLCFEVTESAVVSNIDLAIEFMERIGERGVRFALDDFGSGLSSLNYLKRLPVDFLKIDGTFIRNIAEDEIDQLMVQSVARWSNALGIRTIAEYVERPYLLEVLRDIGIDFVQGFALGKPAPLAAVSVEQRYEFQKNV